MVGIYISPFQGSEIMPSFTQHMAAFHSAMCYYLAGRCPYSVIQKSRHRVIASPRHYLPGVTRKKGPKDRHVSAQGNALCASKDVLKGLKARNVIPKKY